MSSSRFRTTICRRGAQRIGPGKHPTVEKVPGRIAEPCVDFERRSESRMRQKTRDVRTPSGDRLAALSCLFFEEKALRFVFRGRATVTAFLDARVEERDDEDHDDESERQPFRNLKRHVAGGVQELEQQLEA